LILTKTQKSQLTKTLAEKNELRQSKPKTNQNENFEETDFGRKPTKPTKPRQFYKLNLPELLQKKRQANFENLHNQPQTKPKPRNKDNQNQR